MLRPAMAQLGGLTPEGQEETEIEEEGEGEEGEEMEEKKEEKGETEALGEIPKVMGKIPILYWEIF